MLNNKNNKALYLFVGGSVAAANIVKWQHTMLSELVEQGDYSHLYWIVLNQKNRQPQLLLKLLLLLDSKLARCRLTSLQPVVVNNPVASLTEQTSSRTSVENTQRKIDSITAGWMDKDAFYSQLAEQLPKDAVFINCTGKNLDQSLLDRLNRPVYSFYFGSDPHTADFLSGLLEFIRGEKLITSGVRLEQVGTFPDTHILFQSRTSIESVSLCRTIELCLSKSATFLPRLLKSPGQIDTAVKAPDTLKNEPVERLSYQQLWQLYARYLLRVAGRIRDKLTIREQWILLIGKNPQPGQPASDLADFKRLVPPADEFWADPFVLSHRDDKGVEHQYLFFEVFPYERNLGHIACMEINENGECSAPVTVLERPYHLSYPNVFWYQDRYYMIPESGDNQTLELHEAVSFPYQWEFRHSLISGLRLYDSTLIEHENRWWLFAAVAENEACPTTEELYLFHADSPISQDWQPHPENPVISDASQARPAGRVFRDGKRLIRPSQDCAGTYGAGINWCVIEELSPSAYRERVIKTIRPDWDKQLSGVHTFNFSQQFTVSDAIWRRSRFA